MTVSTVKCVFTQHGLKGSCARKKSLPHTLYLKAQMTFAADHIKTKNKKKNGSLQEHVDCAEETSLCQEDNKFS